MVGDILQPTHLLLILVVALLVLGPKRLPEVGRTLGSGLRDFRAAINGETTGSQQTENQHQQSYVAAESAPDVHEAAPPIQFTESSSAHTGTGAVASQIDAPGAVALAEPGSGTRGDIPADLPTEALVADTVDVSSESTPIATGGGQASVNASPATSSSGSSLFADALQGERATRSTDTQSADSTG